MQQLWTGGPATEDDFKQLIEHLHSCEECRKKTWAALAAFQDLTKQLLGGAVTKLMGIVGAEVASPFGQRTASSVIKKALVELKTKPDKLEWTFAELFDFEVYDDMDHMSVCAQCQNNLKALHQCMLNAIAEAEKGSLKEEDKTAMRKLRDIMKAQIDRIDRHATEPPTRGNVPGASFCE